MKSENKIKFIEGLIKLTNYLNHHTVKLGVPDYPEAIGLYLDVNDEYPGFAFYETNDGHFFSFTVNHAGSFDPISGHVDPPYSDEVEFAEDGKNTTMFKTFESCVQRFFRYLHDTNVDGYIERFQIEMTYSDGNTD